MDNLLIKAILENVKQNKNIFKHFNKTYKTQKYELVDLLPAILDMVKYNYGWRFNEKLKTVKCHWSTIYKMYTKLNKFGILKNTYILMLNKYIKLTPSKKLKIILTDTSTIYNKYNTDIVERNKINKNKNVMKISIITDSNGIPINVQIYSGNLHDSNILEQQLQDEFYINSLILDKYKKYFLADKGYDSTKLRNILTESNFYPIIAHNKRNIKDENKIKRLSKNEKKIYKDRIEVEHTFSKLKMQNNRLNYVNEKKSINYLGFLYIAFCKMILNIIG
jgi:hypothetical protein